MLLLAFMAGGKAVLATGREGDESLRVCADMQPGLSSADGTGLYLDLLRVVFEPEGVAIAVEHAPFVRCVDMLKRGRTDAIFGTYSSRVLRARSEAAYVYTPRYPLGLEQVVAVSKQERVPWPGTAAVGEREVAWMRGYDYGHLLAIPGNQVEINNLAQGMAMLELDRFVYLLDSTDTLQAFLKHNPVNMAPYRIEPVSSNWLYVGFLDTARGHRFAELWDARMPVLLESGEVERLHRKWGVPLVRLQPETDSALEQTPADRGPVREATGSE